MLILKSAPSYVDDLLQKIAIIIQLDETRRERVEKSYSSLTDLLDNALRQHEIEAYPQGSFGIGTTVKPMSQDEYDLDFVVQLNDVKTNASIKFILDEVFRAIQGHERYRDKTELKTRCVRVTYAGDFHVDILPAIPDPGRNSDSVLIPDRDLSRWLPSSPKGFIRWFNGRSNDRAILEKALQAEPLPEPERWPHKAPLKVAIQLTKRRRDVMLQGEEWKPNSILLTTLLARSYREEISALDALSSTLERVSSTLDVSDPETFTVTNPTNPEEDFTDKWENRRSCLEALSSMIGGFKYEVVDLTFMNDIEKARDRLSAMFGESITLRAFLSL